MTGSHDSLVAGLTGTRVVPRSLLVGVTGSRLWDQARSVYDVLGHVARFAVNTLPASLVIVHGDCYKGADAIARAWVLQQGSKVPRPPVAQMPLPADWAAPCRPECRHGPRRQRKSSTGGETFCPAAGDYRNQVIVDVGPGMLLGFSRNNSGGTADCLKRATLAGIPTFVLPWAFRNSAREYAAENFDLEPVRAAGGWRPGGALDWAGTLSGARAPASTRPPVAHRTEFPADVSRPRAR